MKVLSLTFLACVAIALFSITSCAPKEEEGIDLPDTPSPSFNWYYLPGDDNRVVFEGENSDGFMRFWDFGNGQTSNEHTDTIFYQQQGVYDVTYSVSNAGGMGSVTDQITIAETVELPCSGNLELLTGCDNPKCWIFDQVAGAIAVGPDPYSEEWFSSPVSGLVPEQYDDSYCFGAEGEFTYINNGQTINPYDGFIAQDLVPEEGLTYFYSPGTGTSGEDQVIIPDCSFIGVMNSGPAYDIIELTETTLVLHSTLIDPGCITGEGFFTLKFTAQ